MIGALFFRFVRLFLRVRYRIEVSGLEAVRAAVQKGARGVLVMPNHPALMDPVIVFAFLWPILRMRPLVVEHIYESPLVQPFMKWFQALPVPCFDSAVNEFKVRRAERSIRAIADGLKQGKNFIIYPSGRLKTTAVETIGGASSAHELVKECPDVALLLVRTTGLWGSSYSRAIEGRSPSIPKTVRHSVWTILRNGIFFVPKRTVRLEMELSPPDLPRRGTRIEFNRFLERWYNQYPGEQGQRCSEEPLSLVSYSFWSSDVPTPFAAAQSKRTANGSAISAVVRDRVYSEIRKIMERPDLAINEDSHLAYDVGMDSLNIGDLLAFLTHEYHLVDVHPEDLTTVRSVLELAEGARGGERGTVPESARTRWPEEAQRPGPELPLGETLAEAFLRSCDRMGSHAACADDIMGVVSYQKMKRSALVLAEAFRRIEETHVGVMLPASAGAFIVILALQFARKVPVLLNWTLGPRFLHEMLKTANAKTVITSLRFLDRLPHVEFGDLIDQMLFLEEVRKKLTTAQKLIGIARSMRGRAALIRSLGLDRGSEEEIAAILFTSGTEAVPKGVPLTHKNIIFNQRSGMQCVDFQASDCMYGILPPFHSFGFNVAGLFPLFMGMKIAFYPDPTDSFALAEGIERWKITVFCAAPSFLKALLAAATPQQLQSIRYWVSGAEKLPQEVREKALAMVPQSTVLEGYGITECAPVLTLCRANLPPVGVGQFIPGVDVCIIHPETLQKLDLSVDGEICVAGPNVFNGYLGNPRSPFIDIDGRRWYRTGDLGHLDAAGNLILSGRLKRFTKIGGEMISLGAIEEAIAADLLRRGVVSPDLPAVAVCSDERIPGKPQIVLFCIAPIERDQANEILKSAGFSRLVRISSVHRVEEIPLMGAGKTDYRKLQAILA